MVYYTKDTPKNACLVEVSNEQTSITAHNGRFGFTNFKPNIDFRNLFVHMLHALTLLEKESLDKNICIKVDINTFGTKDKKPMSPHQIIRAILCSIWAIRCIYPSTALKTIALAIDDKYQDILNELLKNENYKDFVDMSGKPTPVIEYIKRYYENKKR